MEYGDISHDVVQTLGWDFRLLIDVRYPRLFEVFLRKNWLWLSKFTYTWNPAMVDAFNQCRDNSQVLITHSALLKVFKPRGYRSYLMGSGGLESTPFYVIYSGDTSWAAVSSRVEYMLKPPTEIHNRKTVNKVLKIAEKFLESQNKEDA